MKYGIKLAAIAAILLSLTACYTSSSQIYTPDGFKAHKITCANHFPSFALDPATCVQKAGKVCGVKGYQVIGEPFRGSRQMSMIIRCNSNDHSSSIYAPPSSKTIGDTVHVDCVWDQDQAGGEGDAAADEYGKGDLFSNPSSCYRDHRRYGIWVTRWNDSLVGSVVGKGWMQDGREKGVWVFYYADGTVSEGLTEDGNEVGHWKIRRPDGTVIDAEFDNGEIISSKPRN